MSVLTFNLSKTSVISYTHRNLKVFMATRQNKSRFNLKTLQQKYITIVQQNVHNTTTKIMKTLFFKEWSHNISSMF